MSKRRQKQKKFCYHCADTRFLYLNGLCWRCYQELVAGATIRRIEADFKPASDYNAYIFDLFLKYIRRYQINFLFAGQARILSRLLEKMPLTPFASWKDIYDLQAQNVFDLDAKNLKVLKQFGCPLIKIGYMLEELGAIGSRSDMTSRVLESLVKHFEGDLRTTVLEFADFLRQRGRTERAVINYLKEIKSLKKWLAGSDGNQAVTALNGPQAGKYLSFIQKNAPSPHVVYRIFCSLNVFYRYLLNKKRIFQNPFEKIRVTKPISSHRVCTPQQIKQLKAFTKNPSAEPELAMLIALALFWGLTLEELAFASIDFDKDQMRIILREKKRTFQNSHARKDIVLPKSPKWLLSLQKRFYERWKEKYSKLKQTFPRTPLFIRSTGYYNRAVSRTWIESRIFQATEIATGRRINPSVLRQTCGYIFVKGNDGSLLRELGWSRETAFNYTWMPIRYVSDSDKT